MPDAPTPRRQENERTRLRVRDFVVLTLGCFGILTLLFLSREIGLVEWLTAGIVMLAGASAYFVGSQPDTTAQLTNPTPTHDVDTSRVRIEVIQAVAALIQALPFPAIYIGENGRIRSANPAAREVFRITPERDAIATAVIRHPDLIIAIERVAQTGARERVEFTLHEDAETWMAHLQPGTKSGEVLILLEDLTAVHRAELARADFLANASHELRTPLTAVGGFIETLRGPARNDPESWDRFLEIMEQQTERMKRLVADLLSLSRIEFSEHRSPSTKIDLSEVLEASCLSLQPIADAAGVAIELSVPDQPIETIADADEISQVIQNLASNAIKYSPRGGTVSLELGTSTSMSEASSRAARQMGGADRAQLLAPRASSEVPAIWLRVRDSGTGINAQHLPRLGERFYRADESRGGKIEGTGLGLAIVKHIMARHRGGFAVESIEGQGSAFGVWMPLTGTSALKQTTA